MPGAFPSGSASASVTVGPTGSGSGSGAAEPPAITTKFEVDQTQPTTSVQIRLADGTRCVFKWPL